MQRIKESPPIDLLDRIINWARTFIPEKWRFIISQRLKVNNEFVNDLEVSALSSNVRNWQRKKTLDQPEEYALEQRCASYEYLFHKVAYQHLDNETIIPIIETNGTTQYYKTHNLVNKNGFVCTALIPVNTNQENLDIKILFRGTHNIGSAIIDAEKYGAGYRTFHDHEAEILTNLNQMLGKVKQEAQAQGQPEPSISITTGGHSLRGALTQNFYASIIKTNLLPLYIEHHGDHNTLGKILYPIIKKQIEYEKSIEYSPIQNYKTEEELEKLIQERTGYLLKSLDKLYLKHQSINLQQQDRAKRNKSPIPDKLAFQVNTSNLSNISSVNVGILNAAGAPHKIHDLTVDSMALLKATEKQNTFQSRFTNIYVGGDPVQQAGQTNSSAGLPQEHVNVETIKIDSGLEGKAKKQVLLAAAFQVVELFATSSLGLKIPHIPWIPNFGEIIDSIKKAHCDLHFDSPSKKVKYQLQNNQDKSNAKIQAENLTTKIPIVNSEYFQEAKKQLSWVKTIYCKLASVYQNLQGEEKSIGTIIKNTVNKIDEWIGIGNVRSAANSAGFGAAAEILDLTPKAPILNLKKFSHEEDPLSPRNISTMPTLQNIDIQSSIPALVDWTTVYNNVRDKLLHNKLCKIQLSESYSHKPPNEFIISSKDETLSTDQIHVKYIPTSKDVKFHVNSPTPQDQTILQMLTNAQACGDTLTINGTDPKLLKRTIDLAYAHNISNIKVSEKALALLKVTAQEDPNYNTTIRKIDSLHPSFRIE